MRIGLIGAGAVAPLHARAATLLPDIEMTAVCDLLPAAAAAVAEPIDAQAFTDYRDLIASGTTDAVIVNTPNSLHYEMSVAAMKAGLHVLVEKPMAITVEDCDRMTAAAARAGVVLRVGHIQHFLPEKTALVDAINAGEIGQVQMIHDLRTTDYRPGTRSPWFLSPELAGGGAVMNIGAHCLDRVVWFGGAPAAVLSAQTLKRFGVAVETDATITMRLTNGVVATVTIASDLPRRRDEVTVIGTGGSLIASPHLGTLLEQDGHTQVLHEPSSEGIPEAFRRQLADFTAAINGGASAVSQEHSRHVVEMVLATYESSAAGGRPLKLGAATLSAVADGA